LRKLLNNHTRYRSNIDVGAAKRGSNRDPNLGKVGSTLSYSRITNRSTLFKRFTISFIK